MIGVRVSPTLRDAIVQWAENQPNDPSLSEAARCLIELGLASAHLTRPPSKKTVSRAATLAVDEIDRLQQVKAVAPEERESRKRRLLKGPKEFREMRAPKGKEQE